MKLPGATHLVILTWQRWQAQRIYRILQTLLARLGLTLSPEKTRVVNLQETRSGFDFLGYPYRWIPSHWKSGKWYVACWPSRKAMKRARERIRELTPLHRVGLPVSVVVQDLNRYLTGWAAYFRFGNSTRQFRAIDNYVVERLSRFIARKYDRRGIRHGMSIYLSSHTHLGLRTLAGTVVYDSANA
ncbi:group II intron maturase-specific domain-containing protein [Alicyclobacillus shizuokensis]|uniref:group II intron maturase-specific domain-containing protein n=1 Tax=Alicyclobacillus shizuokensis TaxID=392014 RepID=UPI00146FCBBE|nr:group II intron maturase-specific domain-containing protein [Alicyclobacillus shizuokensis]